MIYVLIFLFGLCLGSFLNVLIYRLPRDLSIGGRSSCPKCKKKISWHDNIPLLSFICLRGRCRNCHSPIPLYYPLVELMTALLTFFMFLPLYNGIFNFKFEILNQFTIFQFLITLMIIYSLIVIFVIDLQHEIIPDQIVYPAILITLIYDFLLSSTSEESWLQLRFSLPPSEVFWGYFFSGCLSCLFFLFLYLITRGRGMGFGDVKLALLMGLFLGFPKILVALYLAFLTGAFVGVILMILGKKKLGSHIPFGPFLAGATIISFFFGEIIWQKIIMVLL